MSSPHQKIARGRQGDNAPPTTEYTSQGLQNALGSLCKLPQEVRDIIYRGLACAGNDTDPTDVMHEEPGTAIWPIDKTKTFLQRFPNRHALLHTSSRLREEYAGILGGELIMTMHAVDIEEDEFRAQNPAQTHYGVFQAVVDHWTRDKNLLQWAPKLRVIVEANHSYLDRYDDGTLFHVPDDPAYGEYDHMLEMWNLVCEKLIAICKDHATHTLRHLEVIWLPKRAETMAAYFGAEIANGQMQDIVDAFDCHPEFCPVKEKADEIRNSGRDEDEEEKVFHIKGACRGVQKLFASGYMRHLKTVSFELRYSYRSLDCAKEQIAFAARERRLPTVEEMTQIGKAPVLQEHCQHHIDHGYFAEDTHAVYQEQSKTITSSDMRRAFALNGYQEHDHYSWNLRVHHAAEAMENGGWQYFAYLLLFAGLAGSLGHPTTATWTAGLAVLAFANSLLYPLLFPTAQSPLALQYNPPSHPHFSWRSFLGLPEIRLLETFLHLVFASVGISCLVLACHLGFPFCVRVLLDLEMITPMWVLGVPRWVVVLLPECFLVLVDVAAVLVVVGIFIIVPQLIGMVHELYVRVLEQCHAVLDWANEPRRRALIHRRARRAARIISRGLGFFATGWLIRELLYCPRHDWAILALKALLFLESLTTTTVLEYTASALIFLIVAFVVLGGLIAIYATLFLDKLQEFIEEFEVGMDGFWDRQWGDLGGHGQGGGLRVP